MIQAFPFRKAWRSKTIWFSLIVVLSLGMIGGLAPWIAPQDPYRQRISDTNLPPMWAPGVAKPGRPEYPLGTDRFGRDILSRLIYGTRTAFFLALTAVPLAALIGSLMGLIAGYSGGRLDRWIMLFADMIQSIPGIMFLVIIVLIFRNMLSPSWIHGMITLVVGFAAVGWVSLTRMIRVQVMAIKSQLFVEAAISLGASSRFIILQHLLPNVAARYPGLDHQQHPCRHLARSTARVHRRRRDQCRG